MVTPSQDGSKGAKEGRKERRKGKTARQQGRKEEGGGKDGDTPYPSRSNGLIVRWDPTD